MTKRGAKGRQAVNAHEVFDPPFPDSRMRPPRTFFPVGFKLYR